MRSNKKFNKKKLIFSIILVLFVFISVGGVISYFSKPKIDRVLMSSSYSYLPVEAQNYIKEVYEETGEIILTEKNKEENTPYLNPLYISFLSLSEEEQMAEGNIPSPMIIDYAYIGTGVGESEDIPEKYDLRDVDGNSYVTPVRNQGDLGICWAFSTASVMESYDMKVNNNPYDSETLLLSERQIDYATADSIIDYDNEYISYINREIGSGGNFYVASVALANGISLVDYDWKEYDDTDVEMMELYQVLNYGNSTYELNSSVDMPILNFKTLDDSEDSNNKKEEFLNTIKKSIIENGAAYVGTYYNTHCAYTEASLGTLVMDVDSACYKYGGGHALTVIGWDDTVEYDYCSDTVTHVDDVTSCTNVVSGKGAWILKNSWGEDAYPYLYLAYDSSYSNFHFVTDATKAEDREWESNYLLGDNSVATSITNSMSDDVYGTEKLYAIKFSSYSSNATYEVSIKDADGVNHTYSVSTVLPGFTTLNLKDENIYIDEESEVTISGGTYYFLNTVSVFTNNMNDEYYIDLSEYNGLIISDNEIRLYSETKNIPSNAVLTYKFYDKDNNDVSSYVSVTNNIVAENNINTLVSSISALNSGDYTVIVSYNGEEIETFSFSNVKMTGSGTENDPYVIMNSSHLNQVRNHLDAYYVLGTDIDLTEDTREGGKFYNEPDGEFAVLGGHGWEPINEFSGTFDGQGHTIKGMYQKTFMSEKIGNTTYTARVLPEYGGLFGKTTQSVTIKNLVLEDFDVTCHGDCGILVGHYQFPSGDYSAYDVNFSNIAVKNSKLDLVYDNNNIYAGGVFGMLSGNTACTLNISNIYSDVDIKSNLSSSYVGGLAYSINSFKTANINKIQLLGKIENIDDYYDASVLIYDALGVEVNIDNVFSTVYNETFGANLIHNMSLSSHTDFSPKLSVKNLSMLKIPEREMFYSTSSNVDENATFENNNFYEFDSAINSMIDKNNYNSWSNFDDNWVIKTVDGIDRFPVLKFVDFEYTNIPDIYIVQELNEKKSIYDFIYPNTDAAKRITFKSNDESIVVLEDDGTIVPQASGSTTIHVESYYDGYIKDVPITIEYEPHYIVKFDANGGEGSMVDFEVSANSSSALPESKFTRKYYSFNGWNTEADGSGTAYSDLDYINPAGDKEVITLYAQWLGEEYEITFDPNGGVTPVTSKKVRYGELYGDLPVPYRDGYGFYGWKICSNCDYAMPTGKVYYPSEKTSVLTATWSSNSYTIAFNPNGGDGYVTTMYARNGVDKELEANTFTKSGYTFVGWNTESDGSGTSYSDGEVINLSDVENSLLFLYAQWKPYSYTVTFDSNGGEGTMGDMNVDFDESVTLSSNSFTKVGYTFSGWNTEADGSGTAYTNGQSIKNLSSEDGSTIKLYAQWSANTYEIVFDANGGSGTMTSVSATYDIDVVLPENTFTKEDYVFTGWNTEADGSGTAYTNGQSINNLSSEDGSTIKLYAQWSINTYEIVFDANGGNGTMTSITATYDTDIVLPENTFTKEDYVFAGWNTEADGSGTTYSDKSTVKNLVASGGSITLYAIWVEVDNFSFTIEEYEYIEESKFIDKIPIGTSIDDYKKKIIINGNGSLEVDFGEKTVVFTGSKSRIYNNGTLILELTNIVRGDVNGDGGISALDYVKIKNHIMKTNIITDDVYMRAADANDDNEITALDYVRIKNIILKENS